MKNRIPLGYGGGERKTHRETEPCKASRARFKLLEECIPILSTGVSGASFWPGFGRDFCLGKGKIFRFQGWENFVTRGDKNGPKIPNIRKF